MEFLFHVTTLPVWPALPVVSTLVVFESCICIIRSSMDPYHVPLENPLRGKCTSTPLTECLNVCTARKHLPGLKPYRNTFRDPVAFCMLSLRLHHRNCLLMLPLRRREPRRLRVPRGIRADTLQLFALRRLSRL